VWWLNSKNDAFDAVLQLDQEAPHCYMISTTPAPGNASWQKPYFYFGGPGGKHC
jgi:hypothetical protein